VPSWLDYAQKAMKVYLATKEKVPVFPIQWLALENGLNFGKGMKFSKEGAEKLSKFIKEVVSIELNDRKMIEKEYKKGRKPKDYKVSISHMTYIFS